MCMMSSNFEISYTSCGCNKCPHAADWGLNGLVCYAVCNSIAIYDPTFGGGSGKVLHMLHGHKETVKCVRWLRNTSNLPENQIISASADGTAIIWSWNEKLCCYSEETILKNHTNIVNIADGFIHFTSNKSYIQNETPLIAATASIDSTVAIWRRNANKDIKLIDVLDWNSGFCLDLKLIKLPNSDAILLACAAHDNNIHLFIEKSFLEMNKNEDKHKFQKIHVLTGHEDWVRALDITVDYQNNLYMASSSQDSFVRIYKICQNSSQQQKIKKIQNAEVKEDLEMETKLVTIQVNQITYQYAITLETVLKGHEGWVYGVSWYNPYLKSEKIRTNDKMDGSGDVEECKIKLLTSSMDKTLIIWSQDSEGVWIEEVRLGEIGGNTLGFYGGKFRFDGQAVFGHGYQGSFHMWAFDETNKTWDPKTVVGGHTAEVADLSWDTKGNYILSVGKDQTTRLHAPWIKKDENKITWHEMARPQIHGYDLTSIATLTEHKFVSGAEEKVIRAFVAPNNFIDNFKRLSQINFDDANVKEEDLPQGASVPALGLSNKPVFEQMKKEGFIVGDEYPDLYFSPIYLTSPPTEENLLQNTLWPEVQKLYGHGYEIFSLAARGDGIVLASSCKATSPDHAGIILWNAKTWLLIQKLLSHQLTVTQMAFSPNGKFLLSVSRDRQWSLFIVQANGKNYELLSTSAKESLHTRVIWCCAWTFDSEIFATGSRDGKIGFWSEIPNAKSDKSQNVQLVTSLNLPKESVTALAFAPVLRRNFHILSIGLESGVIHLYRYSNEGVAQNLWISLNGSFGHQLKVKRLAFRPKIGRTGESSNENPKTLDIIQLASCGSDHILKVYDIFLHLI